FHERDLRAARNFGQIAAATQVQRIIYLGGLGDTQADLSPHLRSRQATGDALRAAVASPDAAPSPTTVTEFRAAVIVGSGSLSFEMIRYLTERVPVMICPRWVYTRVQPIAVRDVLNYLVSALAVPESADRILEIGGADVLNYGQMMTGYAQARGLRRWLLPVPVLTPRLSSYWVHWVTPVPAAIAQPLIQGLRNEVIVRENSARRIFPSIRPLDYATALRFTLAKLDAGEVQTTWKDALVSSQGDVPPVTFTVQEGILIEQRQQVVAAAPETAFRIFAGIGGRRGWFYANWAWELRGLADRLIGGVGLRRGRRHPDDLRVGDALDFWRVEAVEAPRLLRLRAEMKVPGLAWLQFETQPQPDGRTRLVQTAFFASKGLFGLLYWYALYPLHGVIFSGMIREIARRAEQTAPTP
ncbi:MAG: SDR family oxidoreductase, partial [Anaerolineae bacterium]